MLIALNRILLFKISQKINLKYFEISTLKSRVPFCCKFVLFSMISNIFGEKICLNIFEINSILKMFICHAINLIFVLYKKLNELSNVQKVLMF